jgi:hypothetical protein
MANVNINWSTTQSGVSSGGWVISDNGNGAGTRIRFNLETSSNCGGSNSSTQSGTATATIVPGPNYDMSVALAGVGEAQDPGFEAITLSVNTPENSGVIYTAAASGGGLGCAVAPVTITQNQPGPFYLPAGTTNTLTISFTTRDSLFHTTACFYQIDLSFEEVDPPTNIQFFRANDQSPDTTITKGDPVVLTYDTLWNGQTSAYTAVIDQGIGDVTAIAGCTIDSGTINLVPPPQVTTTYTLSITGSTGPASRTVEVIVLPPDNEPDQFTFDSIVDAELSTSYDSNIITITGLEECQEAFATNGAAFSVNGGAFSTNTQTVCDGDTIQLRMISSATNATKKTSTLTVGVTSANWNITTKSTGNNVPNPFTFNDVEDAPVLSYVESNVVTITGITGATTVTAPTNNVTGIFETRINDGTGWGAWTTAAKTIFNGQQLQLRIFTSDVLGELRTTAITVGDGAAVPWNVTNVAVADSNPDFFDFLDKINQQPSTLVDSEYVTITGINVPTNIVCDNVDADIIVYDPISGNTTLYDNAATIVNNQQVKLRLTSSPDPGGEVNTNVTIGNGPTTNLTDIWRVFTTSSGDIIPDAFYFINKDNQPPNTYVTSNTVLISGITSPSPISITNGEFRIDGGNWVTTGSIDNGETLQLRILTAPTLSTSKTLSITLG